MAIVTLGIDLAKNVLAFHGVDATGRAAAKDRADAVSRWAVQLQDRVGYWKTIVAIAAKNARMCWAVLARGNAFKLPA